MSTIKQLNILIIFDLQGVIVNGGYPDTCKWLGRKYKKDWKKLYAVIYTKYFDLAANRKITQQQAWELAIEELKLPISVKELKKQHYSLMSINKPLIKLLKQLQLKYKTVMLTKNTRSHMDNLNKLFKLKQYLPVINTWEYQLPKTSPKTFSFLSKRFKVKIVDMIYIDDLPQNLVVASELGVKTILYKNFVQFERELSQFVR